MSKLLSVRIDEDDFKFIEEKSKALGVTPSTYAKVLLKKSVKETGLEESITKYLKREWSIHKSAEHAEISVREFIGELSKRNLKLNIEVEDFKKSLSSVGL